MTACVQRRNPSISAYTLNVSTTSRQTVFQTISRRILCVILLSAAPVLAEDFPDDLTDDVERLRAINGGELRFLPEATPAATRLVHSETIYRIQASSLDDGWVELRQCQHDLDPIERVEIQYNYAELRDLRVTEQQGIAEHWVDGQSVQLRGVAAAARVCVAAQARILHSEGDGVYRLCSGPYHRRFLDGFFPLQLTLQIHYPTGMLELFDSDPAVQPGLNIATTADGLHVNARFIGKLMLHFRFRQP